VQIGLSMEADRRPEGGSLSPYRPSPVVLRGSRGGLAMGWVSCVFAGRSRSRTAPTSACLNRDCSSRHGARVRYARGRRVRPRQGRDLGGRSMDTRGKGAVESMRYLRMLGLCLVAVFAVGAIMAAGASAFKPEWGKCHPAEVYNEVTEEVEYPGTGGKYSDQACTVKASAKGRGESRKYEGAYEWEPQETEGTFAGEELALVGAGHNFTFETQAGAKIECAGIRRNSGFAFSLNTAKTPLWEFEGCTSEGQECTTTSIGVPNEVVANILSWLEEEGRGWQGQMGFVERSTETSPVVGLDFSSHNTLSGEPERLFAPIVCQGAIGTVWVGGERKGGNSIIGTLSPVNAMSTTYTLSYGESSPGVPMPERFAHKKRDVLMANLHNHWEPVAFTGQIMFEIGAREIKATK
jgi:hypothetical protein